MQETAENSQRNVLNTVASFSSKPADASSFTIPKKTQQSQTMKSTLAKFITLAAAIASVSCASGPNAQTGTVLGGLGGAAVGGIIGHQSGRGLEGAAIGGALGAVGGNTVGNAQDQRNVQRQQYQPQ